MSEVRQRRPTSWAVVELTRMGERKVVEGTIEHLLREAFSLSADHPVFIPSKTYSSGGRSVTVHLMEGYAFIASDGRDLRHPSRTDQPYVKRLLTVPGLHGGRVLSVLPDARVFKMEADLALHVGDDAAIGSYVSVSMGMYANMEGKVVDLLDNGDLVIQFNMKSLELLATIPRSMIVPIDGV